VLVKAWRVLASYGEAGAFILCRSGIGMFMAEWGCYSVLRVLEVQE
jgi:hypothetical protein